MSEGVTRLKQLLFDSEDQELQNLSRRLETLAETDAKGRDELRSLIEQVFERAGTPERLSVSVSEVLSTALRRAEITEHDQLADSIAPLVVATIKTELRNSQDELVEALYPMTGRLVKSYVASAIKDLAQQMNRRIEQNAVMLRLQSLMSGKSVAELAMASTQVFAVRDLYLIRRGTGELLARWPQSAATDREQTMSGILAALNEFANEALAADQGSLRQIDLGDEGVYLRASPKLLLAARCSGTAPEHVQEIIDDTFLTAIEKHKAIDVALGNGDRSRISETLAVVGRDLTSRIETENTDLNRPVSFGVLKAVAALVLLPLLGWLGYYWFGELTEYTVRRNAESAIAALPGMTGYPVTLEIGPRGRLMTISGLTPNAETKAALVETLTSRLRQTSIADRLSVIPGPGQKPPDLRPDLADIRKDLSSLETSLMRETLVRASARGADRLQHASTDLAAAVALARGDDRRSALRAAETSIQAIVPNLSKLKADLSNETNGARLDAMNERFASTIAQLKVAAGHIATAGGALTVAIAGGTDRTNPPTAEPSLTHLADQLTTYAERIAGGASTILLATSLEPPPSPPPAPQIVPQIVAPPAPTARQVLELAARAKAVFFTSGTEYRDSAAASETLQALVPVISNAGILVRVVGYTDDPGGQSINVPLAQQRAETVRADLIARGVPADLLVAIGRKTPLDISPLTGAASPNRRVEFEIGFDGEAQP